MGLVCGKPKSPPKFHNPYINPPCTGKKPSHIRTTLLICSSVYQQAPNMKTLVILLCVAVVALAAPGYHGGGGYGHGGGYGPAHRSIYHNQQIDGYGYSGPYNFGYTVDDPYTGDYHGQDEKGDGKGGVSGSYHLREPDGRLRVVKYVADYGGFRATVNGVPHGYGGYH